MKYIHVEFKLYLFKLNSMSNMSNTTNMSMHSIHIHKPHLDKDIQKNIDMIRNEIQSLDTQEIELLKQYFHTDSIDDIAKRMLFFSSNKLEDIVEYPKCMLFTEEKNKKWIEKHHLIIYNEFSELDLDTIRPDDIIDIIKKYDTIWFHNKLSKMMKKRQLKLSVRFEGKPTFNTEGFCFGNYCDYTITLPMNILNHSYPNVKVGGIQCKDKLDALLRVIEHELIHLILFIFCDDIHIVNHHGKLFQQTVYNLFGHTSIFHEIY